MSIIEQAAKRLEELRRAGVEVPWAAAGVSQPEFERLAEGARREGTVSRLGPERTARAPAQPSPARQEEGRCSRQVDLPLAMLAQAGLLVPGQPRSAWSDEFRVIKRPLLRNVDGEGAAPVERANLIVVTSALPGEGKTFTAINLALSIAMELDRTVLLVDADVVRPSVVQRLGIEEAPQGLLDVLTHPELSLADVLLRTNIPKLTLLPSGSASANATELLASSAMERLLDDMATRYADRVIVFDAPPLLATTESRVLASRAGQVVMVVEAGRTPQASVIQAFAAVESCPVVMSVLNKCPETSTAYRYGYY
ncbi:MAG: XrtA-associated tyrosine autokinase [Pseudomonadota bacterium]|uniref:non-specific protein-tyrosine kinase n=1 Tax=Caldimonas aquatica TaxID=376175 RepID=A0ABY6MVZ3_9BURK|nr:XrtA-associated tyrosine autokinase [Schlegelella aquatica]UZD56183.1 XrtA-associated tyrosine autokinase [Schlegelella aquatica]